jgi:hypothetical protein
MQRPLIVLILISAGFILAFWMLLQTPGSLNDALSHPIQVLWGTERQLNATLLQVSETAEPVRAVGRKLLQPLGALHLVRTYNTSDADSKSNSKR